MAIVFNFTNSFEIETEILTKLDEKLEILEGNLNSALDATTNAAVVRQVIDLLKDIREIKDLEKMET